MSAQSGRCGLLAGTVCSSGWAIQDYAEALSNWIIAKLSVAVIHYDVSNVRGIHVQGYRLDQLMKCKLGPTHAIRDRRERSMQDERNEILWRYDADVDGFVLGHDQAVMEEELQAVETNHPRLNVRHLYYSVLEYAAATIVVRH